MLTFVVLGVYVMAPLFLANMPNSLLVPELQFFFATLLAIKDTNFLT